jgi:hypothetical protein
MEAYLTEPSYSKKIWSPDDNDTALFKNLMEQARLRGHFTPSGKIFMQMPVTAETKANEAYKFVSYEEYATLLDVEENGISVTPTPTEELA